MATQGILPGMSEYFAPADDWHPRPHPPWTPRLQVLERIKSYLRGFAHFGKVCYRKRLSMAKRLELAVRTLDRYLGYLRRTGWLKVTRKPRTAIREVQETPNEQTQNQRDGASCGGSHIRETPKGLREERLHGFSPLVMFERLVVRWCAHCKRQAPPEPKRMSLYERLKAAGLPGYD